MNDKNEFSDMEELLRKHPQETLTEEDKLQCEAEYKKLFFTTTQSKQSNRLYLFSLAALLLLAVGLTIFLPKYFKESEVKEDVESVVNVVSAEEEFYVIQSLPERQEIIAQEFDDFNVSRHVLGAPIGRYTLEKVDRETLILKQNDKQSIHTIQAINQKSEEALQQEVDGLNSVFIQGKLSTGHLQRLGRIALHGNADAIKLIEKVVGASSENNQVLIVENLSDQSVKQIQLLVKRTRSGSHKAKIMAIKLLGGSKSVLATHYLCEFAIDLKNKRLARLCIEMLLAKEDDASIAALEQIIQKAKSKDVQNYSRQAMNSLIEGLSHGK